MPIIGLTDRGSAFPVIGHIRKGSPKQKMQRNGREIEIQGKDLTHFRFEFDESEKHLLDRVVALYGKEPRAIDVILPFNDIKRCWDPFREAYTSGALIHRCNGQYVEYAIDPSNGEILVRDWIDQRTGETNIPCGLLKKPKAQRCKPVGRLNVVMPQLGRAAYLTLHTTSVYDIGQISRNLEAINDLANRNLTAIPLVIKRKPIPISTPNEDGHKTRRIKWLLSIEAHPDWVAAKIAQLNNNVMLALAAPDSASIAGLPTPEPAPIEFSKRDQIDQDDSEADDIEDIEEEIDGAVEIVDKSNQAEQDQIAGAQSASIDYGALPTTYSEFLAFVTRNSDKFTGQDVYRALGQDARDWVKHNKGGYETAAQTVIALLTKPQD